MKRLLLVMAGVITAASVHPALPARLARLQAQASPNVIINPNTYQDLRWRSIGPHRGGRSTAAVGVRTQPNVFYMGATGGGVWKTDNYGITWSPVTDGQLPTGSIGAIDVSDSNPDVVYAGTGSEAIRSNVIVGRGVFKSTDAGRTWQPAGLADVGQIGQLKVHPKNPDIVFVAAIGNPFGWGPERGVYRTRDGGKTWQKVLFVNDQTGAVSVAINWSNPNEIYAGAWRGQRKPWTIISGGAAAEGGVYKSTDGGDRWTRVGNGFPDDLIGKVWVDVAQSNPKVVYAQVEAKGAKGGLYRSADSGATWTNVNSSQALRARPFYFNKVFVNPKDENDVWVTELALHHSTDGGKTFVNVAEPHGDNHIVWINPDNPKIMIETNDGGANITQDGARSWSSQFNQPTAEMYHVDADEQFPYLVYGPQQDTGGISACRQLPPTSWGPDDPRQLWVPLPGCESGQVRPIPSGKIVYGDCKGEFARMNMSTGQQQEYWVNPQQRYGKNPKEMMFRFVRQSPIEIDAHNPNVVYHGSQFVHKTVDGGVHWTKFSPDVTANGPEGQVTSGEPITRDMTGEEVYAALYSMRSSRLEPGVFWTGSNDGPGVGDEGQRQDVEERHAERSAAGRARPHDRGLAASEGIRLRLGLSDVPERLQAVSLHDERLRRALDAADRRRQRHPVESADARRARGSRTGRIAVRRHARGRVRVVRSGQALAVAAAEPASDAGHGHQSPSRRSRGVDDGPVVLDHGQRVAAAAAGGERHEADAAADDGSGRRSAEASRSVRSRERSLSHGARAFRRAIGCTGLDANRRRGGRQACRAGHAGDECRGPCGGARGDSSRSTGRTCSSHHARADLSDALLRVGAAGRICPSTRRRARESITTSPALPAR
jgi:photosystem II stability/assembly factor-like uncharacterized protein